MELCRRSSQTIVYSTDKLLDISLFYSLPYLIISQIYMLIIIWI